MKLDFSFFSNDTPDLIRKAIKSQEYWLQKVDKVQQFETEDGDPVSFRELPNKAFFGDEEGRQVPFPAAQFEAFDHALASHMAVHEEIENEHPLIWLFWAGSGDATEEIQQLAEMLDRLASLAEDGKRFPETKVSHALTESTSRIGGRGSGINNISLGARQWAQEIPEGLSYQQANNFLNGSFMYNDVLRLGSEQVDIRVHGFRHLERTVTLQQGNPEALAACLREAVAMVEEPDTRSRIESTVEDLRAQLNSSFEELEQAHSALADPVSEGAGASAEAARRDDEDRKDRLRSDARRSLSDLF